MQITTCQVWRQIGKNISMTPNGQKPGLKNNVFRHCEKNEDLQIIFGFVLFSI